MRTVRRVYGAGRQYLAGVGSMTAVMIGQLDLFDLLVSEASVNDPFYRRKCGSEFPCSAPRGELAVWAEQHREHEEEFAAA